MPSRRADSSASLRRRMASMPPPWLWCPASPLVTATNFTWCPRAANLAAVPAARMSQSSGCAPKAITRSLPSCAVASAAPSTNNKRNWNMTGLYLSEFTLPGSLAPGIDRGAPQNREQGADGGALRHVLHLPGLNPRQEAFDAVHGDVALAFDGLAILGPADVNHARPRGQDDAGRPREFLTDLAEAWRGYLVCLGVDLPSLGELKGERQVVHDLHGGTDLGPAH